MRWVSLWLVAAAMIVDGGPDLSAGLVAAGRAGALQKEPAGRVPTSPASIKEGMRTYGVWCRACHGLRARGDGISAPPGAKPANLVDAEWKHGSTDALIFKNIKEGIAPFDVMKPQGGNLSDTEIWNVVNYLRSLARQAQETKK